jgi:hypothetical protein
MQWDFPQAVLAVWLARFARWKIKSALAALREPLACWKFAYLYLISIS